MSVLTTVYRYILLPLLYVVIFDRPFYFLAGHICSMDVRYLFHHYKPNLRNAKLIRAVHFWATVCKTVRPMLSVRCLSCPVCLSATFVHCGKNAWTDQDETWYAGRPRPGHIVLDGDPAPPSPKGHSPPIFGPYLLRPNGCMDQDVTWYGARPRPWRLCVR